MKKTGLADSPFFSAPQQQKEEATPPPMDKPAVRKKISKDASRRETATPPTQPKNRDTTTPRNHDTTTPRNHDTATPRNHDTTVSRYHDTIIELVRVAVKELGKEAATHRFTQEEKRILADIIYAYKGQGLKTSENEITRVAINFIISDYKANGKNSILDRALKALNK